MSERTLGLPSLEEADLKDKIVLVRVDHNVVKKGLIHDPYRIDATLGTLYHINARGGKIIPMTHVGRPRDKKTGDISVTGDTSITPIVDYLRHKLHIRIGVPDFSPPGPEGYRGIETSVNHLIRDLRQGRIEAIYLPNTRWFTGEEAKGEDARRFAWQLAGLADIFVNDAFGSWQPHASTVGVNAFLPSYAGFLMQKEIANLERVFQPHRPMVSVVAGSKFDTKVDSLSALLERSDHLVLGGVIYNAYLAARYGVSIEGIGPDDLDGARAFLERIKGLEDRIVELPVVVESDRFGAPRPGGTRQVRIADLNHGDKLGWILDVDASSFEEPGIQKIFMDAHTIFVNAVMGLTPHFNEGTIALDQLIDQNRHAVKLYGGGDTMQELKRLLPGLYIVALDSPDYYIFTGGGAVLKAIEAGTAQGMAPVQALLENRGRFV